MVCPLEVPHVITFQTFFLKKAYIFHVSSHLDNIKYVSIQNCTSPILCITEKPETFQSCSFLCNVFTNYYIYSNGSPTFARCVFIDKYAKFNTMPTFIECIARNNSFTYTAGISFVPNATALLYLDQCRYLKANPKRTGYFCRKIHPIVIIRRGAMSFILHSSSIPLYDIWRSKASDSF